jgi:hypothetical protein
VLYCLKSRLVTPVGDIIDDGFSLIFWCALLTHPSSIISPTGVRACDAEVRFHCASSHRLPNRAAASELDWWRPDILGTPEILTVYKLTL